MFKFTTASAELINWAILLGGTASGLLASDKHLYYENLFYVFTGLVAVMYPTALIVYTLVKIFGKRIQTYKAEAPKWGTEIYETFRCIWTIANMTAWAVYKVRRGELTAYVWNIEESIAGASILGNVLYVLATFLLIDFITYWKHRLLHTKTFFAFHC